MQGTNRTIARLPRILGLGALIGLLITACIVPAATAKPHRLPTVRTLPPYGVNDFEAVLNSRISPHGLEAVYRFEYGRTKRYGHITEVPEESLYPYYQGQEFEEAIIGLTPHTVYHYRVLAEFHGKRIFGNDVAFKTHPE